MIKSLQSPYANQAYLAFVLLLGQALPCVADDSGQPKPQSGNQVLSLGIMPAIVAYPGSQQGASFFALPWVSSRSVGDAIEYFSPDDGMDYTLFSTGGFAAGPVVDFRSGRYPNAALAAAGFQKIDPVFEAGVFAEYWIAPNFIRTRIELRQALASPNRGLVVDLGSDAVFRSGKTTFSAGPRITFGNRQYMQTYFGSPIQGSAPGSGFRPGAGVRSAGAIFSVNHSVDDSISLIAFARIDRLLGSANNSPVNTLSRANWELFTGVGLIYSFKWAGFTN